MRTWLITTSVLCAVLAFPSAARVYKCEQAGKPTTYSGVPCSDSAEVIPEARLRGNTVQATVPQSEEVSNNGSSNDQVAGSIDVHQINSRYDSLDREVRRLFGRGEHPSLTRLLIKLEAARSKALQANHISPDARAINIRFDRLRRDLEKQYGRNGGIPLAARLVELEAARDGALYGY